MSGNFATKISTTPFPLKLIKFHHLELLGALLRKESLARAVAAIRITSVRWRSYLPLETQNLVLVDPAFVAL